jgi:hypothetical protein
VEQLKHAANSKAWAISNQQSNGFQVRRVVWGLLMARMERRKGEEIRRAVIMVGPKRGQTKKGEQSDRVFRITRLPRYRHRTFAEGKAERMATKGLPERWSRVGTNADLPRRTKMQTYQGRPIRSSRPAKEGDEGFNEEGGEDQVVVTLQDGTEKCVPKKEVATANE